VKKVQWLINNDEISIAEVILEDTSRRLFAVNWKGWRRKRLWTLKMLRRHSIGTTEKTRLKLWTAGGTI